MNSPDEKLLAFLRDRDIACPSCGYNVRNNTVGRCPECGEELTLQLGLAEPKQAAAIAGLIGLAAGAGLNGLLLIYIFIMMLRNQPIGARGFFNIFIVFNGIGFLVLGGCIAIWLIVWRRIRRMNAAARWSLVAVAWTLSLADIVAFIFTIR